MFCDVSSGSNCLLTGLSVRINMVNVVANQQKANRKICNKDQSQCVYQSSLVGLLPVPGLFPGF